VSLECGERRLWKRPSTPANPAEAIVEGLKEISRERDVPLDEVIQFGHGTTVATNALIQRRGASVVMITTRGFRDLIEIGRQTRPHLYDMHLDNPSPLVPRELRLEVTERIGPEGEIITELDLDELDACIEEISRSGAKAVAVCFLFAYLNPVHEQAAAARIKSRLPDVSVSISSEVRPEFREYERFSTTVINSYLQPVVDRYLSDLGDGLANLIPNARIWINQSNGGAMSLSEARHFPVRLALSGPAAGIVCAIDIAESAGHPNVITIDIGGTSADVALIKDYRAEVSQGRDVDGFPIRLPMTDITTIGAGGGSIAWFDRDGLLKVGPTSAGAVPGPACYGQGGQNATVSDANLVLARLSPQLTDGGLTLDTGAARAVCEHVAKPMNKSVEETAAGIIAIAVANMVRAIRSVSVERGHDPRDFTLMPFGGAGPLHARDVAVALQMRQILVAAAPGIVCAQGLLRSNLRSNFVSSMRDICNDRFGTVLQSSLRALDGQVADWLCREQVDDTPANYELSLDARYVGQNFELSLVVASASDLRSIELPSHQAILEAFFEAHDRAYGFHDDQADVEIVACRISVDVVIMDVPASRTE
jgi:N-methylhydantoinase A